MNSRAPVTAFSRRKKTVTVATFGMVDWRSSSCAEQRVRNSSLQSEKSLEEGDGMGGCWQRGCWRDLEGAHGLERGRLRLEWVREKFVEVATGTGGTKEVGKSRNGRPSCIAGRARAFQSPIWLPFLQRAEAYASGTRQINYWRQTVDLGESLFYVL